jgi:eukaryotic-like serine/threonine-protein kinase
VFGDLTLRGVTIQQYFGAEPRQATDNRNRRAMIEKVWAIWITGVLQPSLPHDILLDLGLTERPAMVTRALDLYVQRPDLADRVQALGTRLIDAFDHLDRALLILGAPGSGKTTLLLTLARDLLILAAQDPEQPIPVLFPLSSWASRRRPLADWLVDALNEQYEVPRKTGQAWVDADQILPLLDGLDEVQPEHRAACVEAINTFRQEHGLLPLVVCSRVVDYDALGTRLRLQGAILVQPLTRAQVDSYLTQIGEPLAVVREAVRNDPMLWELLDTPLMLTILAFAYTGEPVETLRIRGTPEEWRQHLFAAYVDRMFRRRSAIARYTRQETECSLAWLAWQMMQHSLTIFYLEGLQPDWLPQGQRWVPTQGARLVAGLLGGLLPGIAGRLLGNLSDGLVFGLVGGLIGGLVGYSKEIRSTEYVRWTWSECRSELFFPSRHGLRFGLLGGLVGGLLMWFAPTAGTGLTGFGVGLSFIIVSWLGVRLMSVGLVASLIIPLGPPSPEVNQMAVGLAVGFSFGLIYKLCAAFIAGLASGKISTKNTPNEGIYQSGRIAVISGLGGGLIIGLVGGLIIGLVGGLAGGLASGLLLGLYLWLSSWLIIALGIGLKYGGRTCLQHLVLRLMLRYHGYTPRHYVDFLDYAAERIFLRRVGGGYIFIHRMLQDYFAARHMRDVRRGS